MVDTESTVPAFFARLDEGAEVDVLLEFVSPNLIWEFSLPDRTIGGGKAEFGEFLHARKELPGAGRHQILSTSSTGSYDLIAGALEAGGTPRGVFFATARRDHSGSLDVFLLRRTTAVTTA